MIRPLLALALAVLLVGCQSPNGPEEIIPPPPNYAIELPGECYTSLPGPSWKAADSGTTCKTGELASPRVVARRKIFGKTCVESYWLAPEIRLVYGCTEIRIIPENLVPF